MTHEYEQQQIYFPSNVQQINGWKVEKRLKS